MAEKYKLFYSILEGELNPYRPVNTDEHHFMHLLAYELSENGQIDNHNKIINP